jgi:uncharacterized protein (DUF1330 family)
MAHQDNCSFGSNVSVSPDAGFIAAVDFFRPRRRAPGLTSRIESGTNRIGGSMKGYLVFTRDKTLDKDEMATYSKEVPATFAGHEVKFLALYGAYEDMEGPSTEGTVILEFPSTAAAKAWYNSPAYQKVREHRFKGATYRATLVEGI